MKNSTTTGTTIGHANSLKSFTCCYPKYNIEHTSIKIIVLPYDKKCGKFSNAGDSRSIILTRDGCIIRILTGSRGPTDEMDTMYVCHIYYKSTQDWHCMVLCISQHGQVNQQE